MHVTGEEANVVTVTGSGKRGTAATDNVELTCPIGFIESASIDCAFDGSFWQKATGSIQLESNGVRSKTSGINTVANVECTLDIDGVVYEVQQGTMLQAPLSPD